MNTHAPVGIDDGVLGQRWCRELADGRVQIVEVTLARAVVAVDVQTGTPAAWAPEDFAAQFTPRWAWLALPVRHLCLGEYPTRCAESHPDEPRTSFFPAPPILPEQRVCPACIEEIRELLVRYGGGRETPA